MSHSDAARSIAAHDAREGYCPMLGHAITFAYCRTPGSRTPCRRIFACWQEKFDIAAFMNAHYAPEVLAACTRPPQDKMASLLELIRQARQRNTPPGPGPTGVCE